MNISTLRRFTIKSLLLGALGLFATASFATDAPRVKFDTTLGSFTVELDPVKAPKSVANFLKYVTDKHYDGTIFHRVIAGFMAQGGGMSADMRQKATRAPIENESKNGLKNVTGSIAMARTSDPNSATSQFYINLVDNGNLDYPSFDGVGYAVFGKVIEGMDVVKRMATIPTAPGDVPRTAIVINSAVVLGAAAKK
jgi:peptidyl-prolyl cis-trans isomerase A (cyclophilin A)